MSVDFDTLPLVEEYGTELLRTTVRSAPDGKNSWLREPGPLAPEPFAPMNNRLLDTLAAVGEHDGARLAVGEQHGEGRLYHLGGQESVAGRLLRGDVAADLQEPLRALGAVLAALHAQPTTDAPSPPGSRGWRRLDAWLEGRAPSARAAQAGAALRSRLGDERWDRLRGWSADIGSSEELVLAHGAPGMGSVVLDPSTGSTELLTGEDVCVAPWNWDLGWAVGELVEFRWVLGGDASVWQGLVDALAQGYGRGLPEWNRMASLRIALHLHDFSAYVALSFEELHRYAAFLSFLVDQ